MLDDVLGLPSSCFSPGNDNVETISRRWLTTGGTAISQGRIHQGDVHLDPEPKEDARGAMISSDDAEEAPFSKDLTTGRLDVCLELLLT